MNNFNISYFLLNNLFEIFILLLLSILIASILILLSYFFIHQKPDSEKLSVYECGYEPYENSRHIVNINFYIIAIFFIIFDIEILFMLPWILNLAKNDFLTFWSMIDFLFELGLGFFYIWYCKCLNWK